MNGRSPSNCTSITAPRTWVTRPTMLLAIVRLPSSIAWRSDGFSAGNDLDQFLGNVRLAGPVIVQAEPLDHVARIPRGIVHRGHPSTMLTSGAFQQGPVDLDRQRLRQQPC